MVRVFNYVRIQFSKDRQLFTTIKYITGFFPRNIQLYKRAFRHKSVSSRDSRGYASSNERLEYLGDAVLGCIVAEYLFKKYPKESEGFLTQLRARVVSRPSLNKIAVDLGIHLLVQAKLDRPGHSKSINGNALEAFIGAIYLDKGYAYAQSFIIKSMIQNHIDLEELIKNDENYKSKIIEWAQKHKKDLKFELISENGSGFDKTFTIDLMINNDQMGRGTGRSKKVAEQLAARKAWDALKINTSAN